MSLQLICVNHGSFDDAVLVMRHCMKVFPHFDAATIFHADPKVVEGLHAVKAIGTQTEVWVKDVPPNVSCDHVLAVHWDGYIVNADLWDNDWFQYDWMGAPWPWHMVQNKEWRVGCGGFCLFSKRMAQTWRYLCDLKRPHDWQVGTTYRDHFEERGMNYAPLHVACKFSREIPLDDVKGSGEIFGFHDFKYPGNEQYRKLVYQ
jgi:hypothetical protein